MKKIEINIQEPYFSQILAGKKTVEGRLNKGKFFELQVGDILKINDLVEYTVLEKNIYSSFREMIEQTGLENVIPDKNIMRSDVAGESLSQEDAIKNAPNAKEGFFVTKGVFAEE
jgi:ASC-1-like (ASCH) protein